MRQCSATDRRLSSTMMPTWPLAKRTRSRVASRIASGACACSAMSLGQPDLAAMQAGGVEAVGLELLVEKADRAARNQRQRAAELAAEAIQRRRDAAVDRHGIRHRSNIDQRPVEIEKQRDLPAAPENVSGNCLQIADLSLLSYANQMLEVEELNSRCSSGPSDSSPKNVASGWSSTDVSPLYDGLSR